MANIAELPLLYFIVSMSGRVSFEAIEDELCRTWCWCKRMAIDQQLAPMYSLFGADLAASSVMFDIAGVKIGWDQVTVSFAMKIFPVSAGVR